MIFKLLQIIGRGLLNPVIVSAVNLIFSGQIAKEPETGAFRAVVEDRTGSPFAGATVELLASSNLEAKHRGTSSELGIVRIGAVAPEDYTMRIVAPRRTVITGARVRIVAGQETDVGTIFVGPIDCTQPGIICDDFGHLKASFQLPCVTGLQLLRNSVGSVALLPFDKLKRQVIHQHLPEWPKGAPHGKSVSVYVVIGVTGRVLCGAVAGNRSPLEEAALAAAQKWEFKPVIEKGIQVPALGILEFEVP